MVAIMTHVRRVIETIEPHDSPDVLQDSGVTLLPGTATFTGPRALSVDGRPHRFHRAVLATGSRAVVPDIPGLAAAGPLTSDTVWDLTDLPDRLLVLGGGPIGCELSQAFARLGSAVTLVQSAERVLPRVDPDASRVVRAALERDGVDVRVGTQVTAVQSGAALVSAGGLVPFDRVLVAVGVRPVTEDLGLDRAGVDFDARGAVRVDRRLRTTNVAIYAAGDVTQHRKLTHLASYHAGLAASNAVLGTRLATTSAVVPEVIYTDPEVATVGDPTWAAGAVAARPDALSPTTTPMSAVPSPTAARPVSSGSPWAAEGYVSAARRLWARGRGSRLPSWWS